MRRVHISMNCRRARFFLVVLGLRHVAGMSLILHLRVVCAALFTLRHDFIARKITHLTQDGLVRILPVTAPETGYETGTGTRWRVPGGCHDAQVKGGKA